MIQDELLNQKKVNSEFLKEEKNIFRFENLDISKVEDDNVRQLLQDTFEKTGLIIDNVSGHFFKVKKQGTKHVGDMFQWKIEMYQAKIYRKSFKFDADKVFVEKDKIIFFNKKDNEFLRSNPLRIIDISFVRLKEEDIYTY